MNVFISWAKEPSGAVARALREWLPDVIQTVTPWVSSADIGAGERWTTEMAQALSASKVGILCVTEANQNEPWLLFEAGALAKTVEKTFVCPYLIGITPIDLSPGPLTQFMAKTATKAGTWELVQRINEAADDRRVENARLERLFERSWSTLDERLRGFPKPEVQQPRRPLSDMVAETLELVRSLTRAEDSAPKQVEMLSALRNFFGSIQRRGYTLTSRQMDAISQLSSSGLRELRRELEAHPAPDRFDIDRVLKKFDIQ